MTDQDKLEFLRLSSRVLQIEAEIADIKEQLFVKPKESPSDNLGETFSRPMTCMKCNKDLDNCKCQDLKDRLKTLDKYGY